MHARWQPSSHSHPHPSLVAPPSDRLQRYGHTCPCSSPAPTNRSWPFWVDWKYHSMANSDTQGQIQQNAPDTAMHTQMRPGLLEVSCTSIYRQVLPMIPPSRDRIALERTECDVWWPFGKVAMRWGFRFHTNSMRWHWLAMYPLQARQQQ